MRKLGMLLLMLNFGIKLNKQSKRAFGESRIDGRRR